MSKKEITFGRIFWPSLWAALIVSVLGIFIWVIVIGSFIGGSDKKESLKSNTVLHMTLDGSIGERGKSDFDPSVFEMKYTMGLAAILHGLEEAESNDKIKGIFLEIGDLSCGFATAKEIHDAINEFEESGKFVVAYNKGEYVSQIAYYISSAADENYGFPSTNVPFLGLGAELAFFKNTFDKLDVEMQVIRGSDNHFKSAVEPMFRENMSDSSRLQIERYINGLWDIYCEDVAANRGLSVDKLNKIADEALVMDCRDAVKHKLMDATKYRDEVIEILADKAGTIKTDKLNLESFSKFTKKKFYQNQTLTKADKPNVAVILAEGGVATEGDGLTSKEICELFKDVRKNESIKTVVFRVNSPGGSALASDEIWREVKLTNEKKNVIVSMGDVAASGGYYVATPATAIFAEPNTITGSIGVFGVIPYTGKMMENKLGITFDRAQTNAHSILTTNRKLSEEEMKVVQDNVDKIYLEFKQRVADGRGMTVDEVGVIARGRVWTGKDAHEIGLVDELGGLKDAIEYAAKEAGIKEKKVLYYPNVKRDKIGEFIEQLDIEADMATGPSIEIPEELQKYYSQLKSLENFQGMQMRLPYFIEFK